MSESNPLRLSPRRHHEAVSRLLRVRLLNPALVKRAIADGVTQGLIGYATKDGAGRLKLERLKESLFDADVEISDDVYIVKADEVSRRRWTARR